MYNALVVSIFVFVGNFGYAQQSGRFMLKGKVTANVSNLSEIYVINKQSEEAQITERGGYFSILAKSGDSIMFSSMQFKAEVIVPNEDDFKKELLFVRLEPIIHNLDEVVIMSYDHLNAVDLGIIPKGQKSYTPAERKLQTAGDLKPIDFLGLLGGSMAVDPIINAISGRTAMAKKEVEVEKKEFLIAALEDMFDHEFFTEKLKIEPIYIKGFLHYVVENDKFVRVLKSRNKPMSSFLLGELAKKYNELIISEAK